MLIKERSSRELVAAIKLNPEFPKDAAFLNGMQNEIAGVHLKSLLDICDAELFPAAGAAAAPVASPAEAAAVVPPVVQSAPVGFDLLDIGEARVFEDSGEVEILDQVAAARKAEDDSWNSMSRADFNCGVVSEISDGRIQAPKFNVMVFYAHPHIMAKYPRRFRAFKKFFCYQP